jgi:hypothetical protein
VPGRSEGRVGLRRSAQPNCHATRPTHGAARCAHERWSPRTGLAQRWWPEPAGGGAAGLGPGATAAPSRGESISRQKGEGSSPGLAACGGARWREGTRGGLSEERWRKELE